MDGRYETTANCSDNTKITTPKFPRANRSRCAWATSYQKSELQNWYALTEILEGSRYGVDAGTHIFSLRYCHWIANLLVSVSRRYPGVNILLKISQPYMLVELWTEITTALKMRKVVYSNFSPVKSTSSDCSASIKLSSGSPSHGLSLDDYSGSQPAWHRRIYAGALPGKMLIQALKRVRAENPLVLISEFCFVSQFWC